VILDVLCGGMLDSLVPKTVRFDPELKNFGNRLVGELFVRTSFHEFRSTMQGYKSIGCRPLTVI
jgi:hypothetical protein